MANSNTKSDKTDMDQQLLRDLEHIGQILSDSENTRTSLSVDKQILAAAYREVHRPKKMTEYCFSFWRKLSLPLYVGSGFVLTVLAYNTLLVPNREIIDPQPSQPTIVNMESQSVNNDDVVGSGKREKRELPEFQLPEVIPERVITETQVSPIDIGSSDNELIEQGIYTGNQLKKAAYPEKEAWSREIIDLLKKGDFELAKSELNRFKKVYPMYPIEEQIKVLSL